MATILKAGNVASGAQITSDATGILEIRTGTGAGTTAITVGTNQAVTMAGAVSSSSLTVNSNNISAVNSLGFRNRIINGAMVIDQRNNGASVSTSVGNTIYTIDRWQAAYSATSKYTVQQNAGSITPPAGFTNYLGVTSSSAYSVISTDYFFIRQFIEGFNVADLGWGTANAQTITVSFWVRSSLTGTFGGSLRNSAANRSYPFSYTISSANTWEQKTITIAGDTSGTWLTNNGVGIELSFSLGMGSTLSATAGAWAAGSFVSATGATSVVGTNGATFYITGVQLEAGSVATPFERRDYGRELMMCQRYFITSYEGSAVGTATTTNSIFWRSFGDSNTVTQSYGVYFKQNMRATPTVTVYSTGTGATAQIRDTSDNVDIGAATLGDATDRTTIATNAGGLTANQSARCHYTASAEL